jgi:hypothetical protein
MLLVNLDYVPWNIIQVLCPAALCSPRVGYLPFLLGGARELEHIKSKWIDYLGDDKQNEYFSEGLTTEVIFQLSKISDLRVISRSSILRYKAVPYAIRKPVHEIGARLSGWTRP